MGGAFSKAIENWSLNICKWPLSRSGRGISASDKVARPGRLRYFVTGPGPFISTHHDFMASDERFWHGLTV
jgi:hypothetical protein